ncbi:MAG: alpha/beta fold hydrolase [Bdellovibrionaceae bacterium]|nr:alpha/beta fold hydrolase [Pseudobdellovibrionaceae bacterium]
MSNLLDFTFSLFIKAIHLEKWYKPVNETLFDERFSKLVDMSAGRLGVCLLLACEILACGQVTTAAPLTGRDVCRLTETDRQGEIGVWVDVPVDYAHPTLALTQIYGWTLKPFNPDLESFVYFMGGPGASAHQVRFRELSQWNVIYFDQRGVACSRPENQELVLDGRFYSSEAIARDADLLRQKFGIQKWSVYAHSYGTIPGTIYAHLFPEYTKALVLEGVVESGEAGLWNAPHRRKWLQRFYNKLDPELQGVVQKLSQPPGNELLFSQIAFSMSYSDSAGEELIKYLHIQRDLELASSQPLPFGGSPSGLTLDGPSEETIQEARGYLFFSNQNYEAITCRELSAMDLKSNFYYLFQKGKFLFDESQAGQATRISGCLNYGLSPGSPFIKVYAAKSYPLRIPVTYFQGTTDGATEAPMAVHHYKFVAKGFAQLLLKINGGHQPNQSLVLASDDSSSVITQSELQIEIFQKALRGLSIDPALLRQFNQTSVTDWVMTKKNF